MQKNNKVKGNCGLYFKLVTDNSSFGSNDEDTIVLSPRTSVSPPIQSTRLDGLRVRKQPRNISEGWAELNFSDAKPPSTSSNVRGRRLCSSKVKAKAIRYSLQMSPTSPDSTLKDKDANKEVQAKQCSNDTDDCSFEYLTPIEKEAKLRHEKRMKLKQEREQNKNNIFFF